MKNNMNILSTILGCTFFILVGCATTGTSNLSDDSAFTQVTDESIGSLIGKQLDLNGNYISLSEDRTFSGTWKNSPITGTWEMRDSIKKIASYGSSMVIALGAREIKAKVNRLYIH